MGTDRTTLYGTLAVVILPILGIGLYSGMFTGHATKDNIIIFAFVCVLIIALGGYIFYVNTLMDARPKKKQSAGKKNKKTPGSIFD